LVNAQCIVADDGTPGDPLGIKLADFNNYNPTYDPVIQIEFTA
jgi:hypothetical protein